jgi:hypothetical protein
MDTTAGRVLPISVTLAYRNAHDEFLRLTNGMTFSSVGLEP